MREDKFKEYYYKYLNYADKEMIVCSEYRDKNINGNLYPVIVALFENKIVYSISPNYFKELQEILLKKQDICEKQQIIEVLNDYFLSKKMKVSIQIMLRKVKMKEIKLDISNVVDLDKNTKEAYFNSFEKNKNIDYMENKWQKMQKYKYIKGIIKDNKFVSVGFVSNIIENAANIVIQTKDKYKGNGYAKKNSRRNIKRIIERWNFTNLLG